ncbi:MAG: acetyl-CoA acetyltransferase, partial [Chloroflexota bacterium]
MPVQAIKDKAAITGIGCTAFSRDSGTSVVNLAAEASLKAISDAGLQPADIDGVITFRFFDDTASPVELCQTLGIPRCNFQSYDGLGGGWNCAAMLLAAMTIHAGVCRNVLVYRANNGHSELHRLRQAGQGRPARTGQFLAPFGSMHAAATFGHMATAHMARYGTTTLDFAHLAVTQRKHALLNRKAMMREHLSIEDHQRSPWIIYPYRLLDCCLESDNGVAVVVTSAEQARDLRQAPVYIMAGTGGSSGQSSGLWETSGIKAASALYAGAGISAADVDFAELYDPF